MAEEMMLDSFPLESDEAEDWESDEALIEADESAEDIGEKARRRRPGSYWPRRSNYLRRTGGVRGITTPSGQKLQFPAKLATAQETNRSLATQEVGRRTLEARLDRLTARMEGARKNDGAVSGAVTLLIGGGLTAWSLIKAGQQAGGGSLFTKWVSEDTAKMATLASVSQIATTGAKLMIKRRYYGTVVSIAADAFAALQIAGFAIASLYQPAPPEKFKSVANAAALATAVAAPGATEGELIYQIQPPKMFVLRRDVTNALVAIAQ